MIHIFNFCVWQSCLFNCWPEDRFITLVKTSLFKKFSKLSNNLAFCIKAHSGIVIFPIPYNSKSFKLIFMSFNPLICKISTLFSEFYNRNIIFIFFIFFILFLNFPFNWKTMTVPSRYIYWIFTIHLMKLCDYIF